MILSLSPSLSFSLSFSLFLFLPPSLSVSFVALFRWFSSSIILHLLRWWRARDILETRQTREDIPTVVRKKEARKCGRSTHLFYDKTLSSREIPQWTRFFYNEKMLHKWRDTEELQHGVSNLMYRKYSAQEVYKVVKCDFYDSLSAAGLVKFFKR